MSLPTLHFISRSYKWLLGLFSHKEGRYELNGSVLLHHRTGSRQRKVVTSSSLTVEHSLSLSLLTSGMMINTLWHE